MLKLGHITAHLDPPTDPEDVENVKEKLKELAEGYVQAAKDANVAVASLR